MQIPNQMIKYLKFGFGYATDEVCYDIREGRLTREDAKWLVDEYDGLCGQKYIDDVCRYLAITEEEFWEVVDRYVNRDLFDVVNDQTDPKAKTICGRYVPRFTVGEDYDSGN